jgi:hypothetical protein
VSVEPAQTGAIELIVGGVGTDPMPGLTTNGSEGTTQAPPSLVAVAEYVPEVVTSTKLSALFLIEDAPFFQSNVAVGDLTDVSCRVCPAQIATGGSLSILGRKQFWFLKISTLKSEVALLNEVKAMSGLASPSRSPAFTNQFVLPEVTTTRVNPGVLVF